MQPRPRSMFAPVLLPALIFAATACHGPAHEPRAVPPEEARALLTNRNWIDRLPQSKQDKLHVYRFVPKMGGGVYQDRTLYEGRFELFAFEHSGDQVRFILPHTGERKTAQYRIEALRPGEAEGPFDLRLQLDSSPRGPATYYGMRAESEDLDQGLSALLKNTP